MLVMMKIIYDSAVFKTQHELDSEETHMHIDNIQSLIEQPQLHMLVVCSSSVDDQAALIGERKLCIQDLSVTLYDSKRMPITDELLFFYGDKAAQQVERGTQQGGTYKCGSCGCEAHMMDDLAYSLRCKWRSLADLQTIALAGKYGKQAGVVCPFQVLNTQQLQEELRSRNIYHTHTNKRDLQKELARILKGVQRVPTLLLDTPDRKLEDINLHRYCILDCEPLHDIKGHLMNLFTELPYIITDMQLRNQVVELLDIVVPKEKPSGGDYRCAAIRALALLNESACEDICLLMNTIVEISEIQYANENKRNTTIILRLHNLTWLHHELCRQLFHNLHKLGREKFFGLYLHAISCHASKQYEIMCLKSCNTENEERLFGQAKASALNTTNRKPGNILPNILLRL